MKITYEYIKDDVKYAVTQETSYIAERQPNLSIPQLPGGIINLFEQLFVFDDHQKSLFDRYFTEAKAQLMMLIPAGYLADLPDEVEVDKGKEYLCLEINNFPKHFVDSLYAKTNQFIIEHIIWRWLSTMLPQIAKVFYERLDYTKSDISNLLSRRTRPMRRYPSFP